jgi:hypothetical protein
MPTQWRLQKLEELPENKGFFENRNFLSKIPGAFYHVKSLDFTRSSVGLLQLI